MIDGRLSVGVDLDGVLANQVVGVLPRIRADFGVDLTYGDVTHWRLPIVPTNGGEATDIAREIVAAQQDRDYVLSMPMHPGAHGMLGLLHEPGPAVLVDQPWNRNGRDELTRFARADRFGIVSRLVEVPGALQRLTAAATR